MTEAQIKTINHQIIDLINGCDSLEETVDIINNIRQTLHDLSPFAEEPVDFVRWVKSEEVTANDYNPNTVAPPEMELLRVSIAADGYTQPIVANKEGKSFVVVDGFHRNRVGKECNDIKERIRGYLPVVQIRSTQGKREARMASTIRHNRARGKHSVEAMSDIVVELKRRNWSDSRICKELGMEQDEVLRLCQISGLQEIFSDRDFSQSWEAEGFISEDDFEELTDDVDEDDFARTVNTSDENRIFHTFDKWECNKAGFYKSTPPEGMSRDQCREAYRDFLADLARFSAALQGVTTEWKHSCEHYLTNIAMNRIAWLGQAAMCYATGVPAEFRGGFQLLTEQQQEAANQLAWNHLNRWLTEHGLPTVTFDEAVTDRQSEIY